MQLIVIHLCPLRQLRLESLVESFMTKIVSKGVHHFKTLKTRLLNSSATSSRVKTTTNQMSVTQAICKLHPFNNSSINNITTIIPSNRSGFLSLSCLPVTCRNNSTMCKSRCIHLEPFNNITVKKATLRSKVCSKMRAHSARRRSTRIRG